MNKKIKKNGEVISLLHTSSSIYKIRDDKIKKNKKNPSVET